MKSVNNDNSSNGNNGTNWLGFSLSPHMKMEVPSPPNHQTGSSASAAVPTAIPTSFFHSPPPQNLNYGLYYGNEGENGSLFSPLTVMPLKSDGSLCHQATMVTTTTSTPKLEDFFGGATMGTHHYENNDREAMALSLDCIYYHHQDQETNNQNFLNQQNPTSQQHHQFLVQQYPSSHYPNFRTHEMLMSEVAKEAQVSNCNLQLPTIGDDESGGGPVGAMAYGDMKSLSLSMSPGSQSSCVTGSQQISLAVTEYAAMESKKRGLEKVDQKQIVHRKSIDTFGQRTSQYRGVTRHRWTGRYEAHLWDNSFKKEGQSRKGRQVYLGGYDMEEKAARAYDLAALKYWGPSTHINFPLENYRKELDEMKNMTRQEYVAHLRRKSSGFSRGASMYRGVTRHHQHGRWQARIGRVAGNKDLYLGTFSTQEEAAEAYDVAAIKFRGVNAVTNFDITRYDVERIMASNTLLAGELARRNREIGPCHGATDRDPSARNNNGEAIPSLGSNETQSDWKVALYQPPQQLTDQKAPNFIDNYKTQTKFSLAPEGVIGIDSIEESAKMGTHLSNASSLVTSLSSSREDSPDRGSHQAMVFAMPPSAASELFNNNNNPTSSSNSWIPSAPQVRPAVSLPHMPVFAAWTDA